MTSRAIAARNLLGNTCRHHPDDAEAKTHARRDLAAAKIADYIEKIVSQAPPLTDAQRESISALLRTGAS